MGLSQQVATDATGPQAKEQGVPGECVPCGTSSSAARTTMPRGDHRQEGEEGRRPRVLKDVVRVSRKEREEHEATHTPFRPWCEHCVRGRARNEPHMHKKKGERMAERVPRVSMDYFFMSEEDKEKRRRIQS